MINWITKIKKKSKWKKLNKKGARLRLNGDLRQAIRILEKARIIALKIFSYNDLNYAITIGNLAELYHEMGEHAKAEPLYLEVKQIREQVLGREDPDYIATINNLAKLYYEMGKHAKVELFYLEAKQIYEKLGFKNLSYIAILNNLVKLYYEMEKHAKMELGQKHLSYITILNSLAELYHDMGEYTKAKLLYLEVKKIGQQVLGRENPSRVAILNNLAKLCHDMGEYTKAEPLYLEVKKIREQKLGRENPNCVAILNNLAKLYHDMGEYTKAEPLYLEVKKIREQKLGRENPNYVAILNNLADLHHDMGEYTKAKPLYLEVKQVREQERRENPDNVKIIDNLADLYHDMEEYAKAEPLYLEVKQIREQVLGRKHPDYLTTINSLVKLYYKMGKYAKAEPMNPDYITITNSLAELYKEMGEHTKAELLYLEVKKIYDQMYCNMNNYTAMLHKLEIGYVVILNDLAELYHDMGEYAKAEPLYLEVKKIGEQVPGFGNPDYATILNNLVKLYHGMGEHAKAESLYLEAEKTSEMETSSLLRAKMSDATSSRRDDISKAIVKLHPSKIMTSKQDSYNIEDLLKHASSIDSEIDRMSQVMQVQQTCIRRQTDVSFPGKVQIDKIYNLRIRIIPTELKLPIGTKEIPKPHAHDVTMTLETHDRFPVTLTVHVTAENFEIQGKSSAKLEIPKEGNSSVAIFPLIGQEVGEGRIMIDFFQEANPVGSIDIFPKIIQGDEQKEEKVVLGKSNISIQTKPCQMTDITIKVFEYHKSPGNLHFAIHSNHPQLQDLPMMDGDLGVIELRSEIVHWVKKQFQILGNIIREEKNPEAIKEALANLGYSLYDQLLPPKLKQLYWIFSKRKIKTIIILSDEPYIPWELIKPYRLDTDTKQFEVEDEFWGMSYAMTRWLRGRGPVDQLSFNNIVAMGSTGKEKCQNYRDINIVPKEKEDIDEFMSEDNSISVEEELKIIRSLEGKKTRVQILPASRSYLKEVFTKKDFNLFHLVSHGSFEEDFADGSSILVDDGLFSVAELSPKMLQTFHQNAPLIFFNTCHSGRTGFSLTRFGSWAARFIEAGCGAFIGTLWPVSDSAALAFAHFFYSAMVKEENIGEAIRLARHQLQQLHPDDPTCFAYCCFASPTAKIST